MKKVFKGRFLGVYDPALMSDEERVARDDGSWNGDHLATIVQISLETVPAEGRGRRPHERVAVRLALWTAEATGGYGGVHDVDVEKVFELNTAAAVAEARRFFALFDFPLVAAGDLPAACMRARVGVCRIRLSNHKEANERVEFLGLERWCVDNPDRQGGKDIWNHERHWRGPHPQKEYQFY